MKKQFFRVKQFADQTFSRAGRTEALSDDLQGAERRIEFIKSVCQNSGKKLANPAVGLQDSTAREKRLKKNPEYCLGSSMVESASGEEERLLREVVTDCGKLLMCLATTYVDHEIKIESSVVAPLLNISDNEYPNIVKQKRNLHKLILDMDSARTRYQTALKHHNSSTTTASVSKIKEELEEAETKVEQCRDSLACDMLQMIARESEVSMTILEYAQHLRNYHRAAVALLDEIIPEMETSINKSSCRPVFGRPLEEHLQVTGRMIAYPIELCVCALLELGINEEGLFRVTAGASKVRRVKLSLDANCLDLATALQFRDPHLFTGVLKSYLRELPEPLLTHALYDQWMQAARVMSNNSSDGLTALWKVLQCLPSANLANLEYLIKFFASLASNKQSNKMTTQNLAIVITPNLIWGPSEDSNSIGMNMNTASLQSIIVDTLICYCDWFFPKEMDFYVSLSRSSAGGNSGNIGVTAPTTVVNGHVVDEPVSATEPTLPLTDMKRTQSNSSLSDQHSPPLGSPKPAIRVRRQKSAAPNPPVNILRREDPGRAAKTEREGPSSDEEVVRQERKEEARLPSIRPSDQPIEPATASALDHPPPHQVAVREEEKEEERRPVSGAVETEGCGAGGGGAGAGGCRPVPAPRSTVPGPESCAKPSVPQRPANLPRPHSSSFRIARSPDHLPPPQGVDHCVSLERTHMYSVDKQQVAIVEVNNDKLSQKIVTEKKECGDKPEKGKKPERLGTNSGHQRAASEGTIADHHVLSEKGVRPPRPTPPPPPVPRKESTDL